MAKGTPGNFIAQLKAAFEADGAEKVTLAEMKEFKDSLSDADRAEFTAWLNANDYPVAA